MAEISKKGMIPEVELVIKNHVDECMNYDLDGCTRRRLYPYIAEKLCRFPLEHTFVMYSTLADVPICYMEAGVGNLAHTPMEARTIMQGALSCNASKIVVFHNHPDGLIKPSEKDVRMTDCLVKGCRIFNMYLMDHVIVGYDKNHGHKPIYYSLAEKKKHLIFPKGYEDLNMKGTTNQESFLTFSPDKCSVTKYLGMDYEDIPGILPVKMYTDLDRCLEQNAAPDDPDIFQRKMKKTF